MLPHVPHEKESQRFFQGPNTKDSLERQPLCRPGRGAHRRRTAQPRGPPHGPCLIGLPRTHHHGIRASFIPLYSCSRLLQQPWAKVKPQFRFTVMEAIGIKAAVHCDACRIADAEVIAGRSASIAFMNTVTQSHPCDSIFSHRMYQPHPWVSKSCHPGPLLNTLHGGALHGSHSPPRLMSPFAATQTFPSALLIMLSN